MGYRNKLIRLFTFLGGLYFFLEFVLPGTIAGVQVDAYHDKISNGFVAIGAMALGLGLINLLMVHGSKVVFRRKGWFDSSALLLGLALMTSITTADWMKSLELADQSASFLMLREFSDRIQKDHAERRADVPSFDIRNTRLQESIGSEIAKVDARLQADTSIDVSADHPDFKLYEVARSDLSAAVVKVREQMAGLQTTLVPDPSFGANQELGVALGTVASAFREVMRLRYKHTLLKRCYEVLYQGFFVALGAAMFSLLGFYIAAAAYRAFRIRSAESALMMAAAVVVMLGQIPFGIWLWEAFPDIRLWLLSVPNSGAFRAIKIGAAVAGLVMAFRMWFSIETESFSKRGENT